MAKNKTATEKGAEDGAKAFAECNMAALLDCKHEAFVRASAVSLAESSRAARGMRAAEYATGFVAEFMRRWREAYRAQPHVRAAARIDAMRMTLANKIKTTEETLRKFADRLAKDPFGAFEYGRDAAQAAAELRVARHLAMLLDTRGLDMVREVANREALRGARWPQHSTSQISNLVHEFMTSAYAEFAAFNDE